MKILWISNFREEIRQKKIAATLNQLNLPDFSKPVVFMDGGEPFKIDFRTFISGIGFSGGHAILKASQCLACIFVCNQLYKN